MNALLLILAASLPATETIIDGYLFGASKHNVGGLNEVNPGLGLGVGFREGTNEGYVVAAGYKDSYANLATLGMVGVRGYVGDLRGWHGSAALNAGWLRCSSYSQPVVVPVFGGGFDRINLEITAMPYGNVQAIGAWLRIAMVIP